MLLPMMGEERKETVDMIDKIIDKVTFYINPEIYQAEQSYKKTGKIPGQNINMEFKRHSESAKKYGKPDLSPMLSDAVSELYSKDRKKDSVSVLMGKEGTFTGVVNIDEKKPSVEGKDDELG